MCIRDRLGPAHPHPGGDPGQHQVEHSGLGVHDAAGQAQNGHAAVKIPQQEHGSRQDRRAVGDNLRPGVPDGAGGPVVRVHAHAAGAQHHIHPLVPEGQGGGGAKK